MNKSLLPTDVSRLGDALVSISLRVRNLEAREKVPIGAILLYRTSAQSISSTLVSTTPISWETFKSGLGFTWTAGAPTKIYSAGQRTGERIEIGGFINWDTNATNRRETWAKVYTAADALRESYLLHGNTSGSGGNNAYSIFFPYEWTDPTDYIKIEVAQNSGSPLNLNSARIEAKITR